MIQAVTFLSPSWRSQKTLKKATWTHHPKRVTIAELPGGYFLWRKHDDVFETSVNSQKNRKYYKLCAEEIVVTTKCVLKAFTPNSRASTKRLKKVYEGYLSISEQDLVGKNFGWFFFWELFHPLTPVPWKAILTLFLECFFSGSVNHVWKEWQWDFSGQIHSDLTRVFRLNFGRWGFREIPRKLSGKFPADVGEILFKFGQNFCTTHLRYTF